MSEVYRNVFDSLEADQEVIESLKFKSWLMITIETHIERNKLTQKDAAKLMGVSQPRISDLVRGKISLFTIDMLINMLSKAGLRFNPTLETIPNDDKDETEGKSFCEAACTVISAPSFHGSFSVCEASSAGKAHWNA